MRRVLLSTGMLVGALAMAPSSAGGGEQQFEYIVVLEPGAADVGATAAALSSAIDADVSAVYSHAIDGFAVTTTPAAAAELAADPRVQHVERDLVVTTDTQTTPTGIGRIGAASSEELDIDGSDDVRVDVDVAVIDTGVDLQQPDLNIAGGVNCTSGTCVTGGDDTNFHGTHVAGIIGALDNGIGVVGVAPGARIWAVQVLNGNVGSLSGVIAGIDWVTAHASIIEVANMSLGAAGTSQAMHDAIQAAVDQGVAFAVAAGNDHVDASGWVPASFDNVLTTSALADFDGRPGGLATPSCANDVDDTLASYSNFGAVDIAAPGSCILSTVPIEWGSYGYLSGTSMASPHVAGALALRARATNPSTAAGVQAIYAEVLAAGNHNWTDDSGDGVQEPLLDVSNPTLFAAAAPGPCATTDATGLMAWWRGDDSATAVTGPSLIGNIDYTTGKVGRALSFTTDRVVDVPGFPTVSLGISVEAWIKPTFTGLTETVLSRYEFAGTDDTARTFALRTSPFGDITWETDERTSQRPVVLHGAAPQLFDGHFHHIAATWDTTTINLYLDGTLLSTMPSQGGTLNSALSVPTRMGSEAGIGTPFWYQGAIDELSVWSRTLTAGEVAAINAAGSSGKCPSGI